MGASVLTNAIAKMDEENGGPLFDGACVIQAPMKIWICVKSLKSNACGLYNYALGKKFANLYLEHEAALREEVQRVCDVELRREIESWSTMREMRLTQLDRVFVHKLFGFEDLEDLYDRASCIHSIPLVKTPTLFINTLDDPILGADFIEHEVFEKNENVAFSSTKYGGHLGYHESLFNQRFWILEPAMKYFNGIVGE